jgi:hypothetical protein
MKWEYRVIQNNNSNIKAIEMWLNNLGSSGWDLVTAQDGLCVFKKEKD